MEKGETGAGMMGNKSLVFAIRKPRPSVLGKRKCIVALQVEMVYVF